MQDAINEMSHYAEFDFLVVNDDFDQALQELKCIIMANRLRQLRQERSLETLLIDLLN
jgi:guanylate kinase